MPCLHSLRSWAMHFTFARFRLADKMIISPRLRLRLRQIICIGALINCLSLNNPLITTIKQIDIHKIKAKTCTLSPIFWWFFKSNLRNDIFNVIYGMTDKHEESRELLHILCNLCI